MSGTIVAAPRAVFSVLEGGYRDRAVADAAVAGRFDIAGRELTLGVTPVWTVDPHPDDKEWRIEWTKFYYGLDLAHAFAVTRDARYADTWARLVTSFVAQVPPAAGDTEVMARRIQNWIYAWNRLQIEGAHAGLADGAAAAVVDYLWAEAQHVRAHLTAERNHRTLELYALLVAALAFPQLDTGHTLRDFALEQLHLNLLADVRPDGVHREHSTHYHCIVLRSFLGTMQNAQLAGLALPASFRDRVAAAVDFALHCHRPDGAIPACSDSDSESYRDVLRLAAGLLDRPDALWVATLGAEGVPPVAPHANFADAGYYTQRSGWGASGGYADEAFLIFDCGALGDGGHGHYDALSVEIAAHGQPLLVDPGRYTYAETAPNWRRWFKGTAAHNTVLVDGLDQTPYRRRKPKGPVATARLLARASAPGLDVLIGETTSPCYDAVHTRAVVFVAGEYWIVADTLAAAQEHDYQVRWHLAPDAGAGAAVRVGDSARVEAAGVRLTFAPAGRVVLEDGWYAPRYGVKHPAPVAVRTVRASCTTLVTAIDPRPLARGCPPLALHVIDAGDGPERQTRIDVRGAGPSGTAVDALVWSAAPQPLTLGPFSGIARAAWTRVDPQGRLVAFAAAGVVDGTWAGPGATQDAEDGGTGRSITWTSGAHTPVMTRTAR